MILPQAVGFQKREIPEQLAHFLVADEVGGLTVGIHGDMAARVGAVRPIAPHLGQIEHLAHDAESTVRLGRLVDHLFHRRRHVGPLHVLHLHAAEHRDDATVDDRLIPALRAGLVTLLGVVLHELLAQVRDRGGGSGDCLIGAGIAAQAHLRQPLLRQRASLLNGQLPEQAQSGLAALPGVRAVLEHEDLAARWCNLAQEAGHQRVPKFDGLRLGICRLHGGLGELDSCHDDSSEGPDSQEPSRGQQRGS